MRSLLFSTVITYKRIEGLAEEKMRLDDAYRESSMRHEEEAKPQIGRAPEEAERDLSETEESHETQEPGRGAAAER